MKLIDKSAKTNWKFIAIAVVLGSLVGVGTLRYVNSLPAEPQTLQIVAPRPTPSPTPSEIDTSDWQTYRNEEFGFEVRYPTDQFTPDWEIPSTPKEAIIQQGILWFRPRPVEVGSEIALPEIFIVVSRVILQEKLFPATYVKSSEEKIKVAGKDVWKEVWRGDGGFHIVTRIISDSGIYYRVQGDFSTTESYEKYSNVYDQILSTFRFLQKEGNNEQLLGDAANKEECLVKGGVWQKWGLAQLEYCQIPAKDAGKSCTDESQCTYGCVSETGTVPGKCATYKNTFGCFSPVKDGKAEQALCVD